MENSIYIHIPFCVKKCDYCDFLSFGVNFHDEALREEYVKALIGEIGNTPKASGPVSTVYLGGGTPSLLTEGQLERIMDALRCEYEFQSDAEISMEVNPGTVDEEKLHSIGKAGINRLSIGVQSFDDKELKLLGRIHDRDAALRCCLIAKKQGFTNVNIDLMLHIPGQSMESLRRNLETVKELSPEHISCYSLIIEEGTPFHGRYRERPFDEETEGLREAFVRESLCGMGYVRYEISNYSRPGSECRHNLGCWHRNPYRGYGLGAASLFYDGSGNEYRFTGEKNIQVYITRMNSRQPGDPFDMGAPLTKEERMEEFMFLGLRCTGGIMETDFSDSFGETVTGVYGPVIDRYLQTGFMSREEGRLFLTAKGLDVSNVIMSEFLL